MLKHGKEIEDDVERKNNTLKIGKQIAKLAFQGKPNDLNISNINKRGNDTAGVYVAMNDHGV